MKTVGCMLIFLNGIVLTANLSLLVPTNEYYEATWVKVIFSFCFAIFGFFIVLRKVK
ncbi:MAG: hypothetical protein GY782_08685 [Gammaproteobacteria bacterium]|nr:hypothetical protein [Gammaproteobacteria bacterium]